MDTHRKEESSAPSVSAPVHSFITLDERQLYGRLASLYRGLGVIVDAGCFAGSSTTAICEGLPSTAAYKERPVLALDRFVIDDHYIAAHFASAGVDLRMGESFLPVFMDTVAPFIEMIEVRAGDVFSIGRITAPIELLFIDIAKNPSINSFAIARWIPNLIPEISTLCHQDFFAPSQPWIAVSMGMMMDHFDLVRDQAGESAAFKMTSPLTADVVQLAARSDCRSTEGLYALDRMIELMGPDRSASLRIMRAHILRHLGKLGEARHIIGELVTLDTEPSFPKWRQWLAMAITTLSPDLLPSARMLAEIYVDDAMFRLGEWRASSPTRSL